MVPGPAFSESINLATEQGLRATVVAGESLILHASRRSGPWVAVGLETLPEGACWLARVPRDPEFEVADNIRWVVDPSESAKFNLGVRSNRTREVRFSELGLYSITGVSSSWCGEDFGGDTLVVEVVSP